MCIVRRVTLFFVSFIGSRLYKRLYSQTCIWLQFLLLFSSLVPSIHCLLDSIHSLASSDITICILGLSSTIWMTPHWGIMFSAHHTTRGFNPVMNGNGSAVCAYCKGSVTRIRTSVRLCSLQFREIPSWLSGIDAKLNCYMNLGYITCYAQHRANDPDANATRQDPPVSLWHVPTFGSASRCTRAVYCKANACVRRMRNRGWWEIA